MNVTENDDALNFTILVSLMKQSFHFVWSFIAQTCSELQVQGIVWIYQVFTR